ncbi:MAG: HAD family hydrolase, partial [Candidatus Hodarchaeota archaeon]
FDGLDFKTREKYITSGEITLYPDVLDCLNRLKNNPLINLALHTNTPYPLTKHQLASFNLDEGFFDLILALDMDEYDQLKAKPEPWGAHFIMGHFLKENGVDYKKSTVFIGDSYIDMMTAKNAGIPGVQILREGRVKLDDAFHVITSLNEIDLAFTRSILENFFHGE